MLPYHEKCKYHPIDADLHWLIRVGLGWVCISLANVIFPDAHMSCSMWACLDWCFLPLTYVVCLNIISLGWWCFTLADVDIYQSMHICHKLWVHALDDATSHYMTSCSRCVKTLVEWSSIYWCRLDEAWGNDLFHTRRCINIPIDAWKP